MDAADHPDDYEGKTVILRGAYAESLPNYHNSIILGRRAMVCCTADTSLCGITVTGVKAAELKLNKWYEVEGKLKTVPIEGGGKTLVLYASRMCEYTTPDDEYVYFS